MWNLNWNSAFPFKKMCLKMLFCLGYNVFIIRQNVCRLQCLCSENNTQRPAGKPTYFLPWLRDFVIWSFYCNTLSTGLHLFVTNFMKLNVLDDNSTSIPNKFIKTSLMLCPSCNYQIAAFKKCGQVRSPVCLRWAFLQKIWKWCHICTGLIPGRQYGCRYIST